MTIKCCLCNKNSVGSKQFNVIVERVYLCRKHLIETALLESFDRDDNLKFIEMMKNENK